MLEHGKYRVACGRDLDVQQNDGRVREFINRLDEGTLGHGKSRLFAGGIKTFNRSTAEWWEFIKRLD